MDIANWLPRKKEENPSLPGGKLVRGYVISRLPLGEYLAALDALQNLPVDLLSACFPGASLDQALQTLKTLDEKALVRLVTGMAGAGAPYALMLVSRFSGIPEKELRDDPAIGLDGLAEIVRAIWEVNGLGNVAAAVRKALPQKPKEETTTPTGSRA